MEEGRLNLWESLFRKALLIIDSAGEANLPPERWTFGGGTVLMQRYRHRFSKDIDIFVPDPQYLGHLTPRLNDTADAVVTHFNEQANFLKLYLPEGEIDVVVASPLTHLMRTWKLFWGGKCKSRLQSRSLPRKSIIEVRNSRLVTSWILPC